MSVWVADKGTSVVGTDGTDVGEAEVGSAVGAKVIHESNIMQYKDPQDVGKGHKTKPSSWQSKELEAINNKFIIYKFFLHKYNYWINW